MVGSRLHLTFQFWHLRILTEISTSFRNIFRHALHWILSKSWPENNHTGGSPSGGEYSTVKCRHLNFDCVPFQVLTKDSVTVSVDAVVSLHNFIYFILSTWYYLRIPPEQVYYRVSNATISVANVENAHHSTRLLSQTTLRWSWWSSS